VHDVVGATVGRRRALADLRRPRTTYEPLLVLEHSQTHHRITIQQRCDRELLLSCYEQTRQILQCRIDRFGGLEEPQPRTLPNDHAAVQGAFRYMRPLAERYASGELKTVIDLKAEHKRLMKELPPPPDDVDQQRLRTARPRAKPRKQVPNVGPTVASLRYTLKKRLGKKTKTSEVERRGEEATPTTATILNAADGRLDAAAVLNDRIRRMKAMVFIDEVMELEHARGGVLDAAMPDMG
jgi:hypothetical protein